MDCWLRNLEAHWERIRAIDPIRFNEKFRRTWLFYLGGAAETFEAACEVIKGNSVRRGRPALVTAGESAQRPVAA